MHVPPCKFQVFLAGGREPALHRVIVMRTEVADAVLIAAVRQVVRLAVGVERKFHYPHTGQSGILQQLLDFRRQIAQILGDKACPVEPAGQHPHKAHSRALTPTAVLCGLVAVGHGPVALHPAEVVDAQHVEELRRTLDPADPPAVAVRLHALPVVQGIPPELSVRREGIGRDTGDLLWDAF